jgi:hypothetical protein
MAWFVVDLQTELLSCQKQIWEVPTIRDLDAAKNDSSCLLVVGVPDAEAGTLLACELVLFVAFRNYQDVAS